MESNRYSVDYARRSLTDRFIEYIESEYLSKNEEVRAAVLTDLQKPGVLVQHPYLEANPAYEVSEKGIAKSECPEESKQFLLKMANCGMGVFHNPYTHQIEALEAFNRGEDIFVSTGTGSGKTECFMWPMVSKLFCEASAKTTWDVRGIRVLMLYPMNALVGDQVGRLRRMIGQKQFRNLFRSESGSSRIPTFGMYTGRTPYPGNSSLKDNREYAQTLRNDILDKDEDVLSKLSKNGKIPAKNDLESFVEHLEDGSIYDNRNDSELILRSEMQRDCPDVLITNYSMLEYMLIRPIENSIWDSTREWLNSDGSNKLLFIIDEAHMYRGSSGGEVSLLIRRVLNRLKIPRSRVQFILTSASTPEDKEDDVQLFANHLTTRDMSQGKFRIIRGTKLKLDEKSLIEADLKQLDDFDIDALQDESTVFDAIVDFCQRVGLDTRDCPTDGMDPISDWLFNNLTKSKPVVELINLCRIKAQNYEDLVKKFENNRHAVDSILAILPFAKSTSGQSLFPTKMHMFFRGLPGLFACINPVCTYKNHNMVGLGRIYTDDAKKRCDCGARIFELMNDRSCGTLFLRGYLGEGAVMPEFIWNNKSFQKTVFKETHLYIISGNEYPHIQDTQDIWVDSFSGKVYTDDDHSEDDGYIHLLYKRAEGDGPSTFKKCPVCKKSNLVITDFATKGNDPFFNVISKQLMIQPPTLFSPEEVKETPNKGRKVLLFSDSRQNAANLAVDISDSSLMESFRSVVCEASKIVEEWRKKEYCDGALDDLYIAVLKVIYEHNLKIFYGKTEETINSDMEKSKKQLESPVDRKVLKRIRTDGRKSEYYRTSLLKLICDSYRSLTDLGLCWIEPLDFEDYLEDTNIPQEQYSELKELFVIWATFVARDSYAITILDDGENIRPTFERYVTRFGIDDEPFGRYKDYIETHYCKDEVKQLFENYLSEYNGQYFLNSKKIALNCEPNHRWLRCNRCKKILPYSLGGRCGACLDGEVSDAGSLSELSFLRKPVLDVLNNDFSSLVSINAEEHTAQLSHKDQRNNMFATTEDYELRFQNIYTDDSKPVDILSCTTTMEVGIDIGSLTAVGLRNIPPSRENYQQRAGRAGRRSSSVSTIVSYCDRGRYDNYYFNNPEKMVSGSPRTPWIDSVNQKLTQRHIVMSVISDYVRGVGGSIDKMKIIDFYSQHYDYFLNELRKTLDEIRMAGKSLLIPDYLLDQVSKNDLYSMIRKEMDSLRNLAEEEEKFQDMCILDFGIEQGLIPTYSFPRNVVGFSICKKDEGKPEHFIIDEQPDRQLDLALREYAPGKEVVVKKRRYVSGAVFGAINNRWVNVQKKINSPYHNKAVYICKNAGCKWFSLEEKENCPFCGSSEIESRRMLVPWGFAPENGDVKRRDSEGIRITPTYPDRPCYSIIPDVSNMVRKGENLRFETRPNQKLIILNQGPNNAGFSVCSRCGATVPGNADDFDKAKIRHPLSAVTGKQCVHHPLPFVLGYDFTTDLIVFEITLNPNKIDSNRENMWIDQAAVSLSEALCLSAGEILGVDPNDIQNGYRIIEVNDKNVVEIFLFDNLSSGAGYCAQLADRTEELFETARKDLQNCTCDSSCFNCLRHYWNKNRHDVLDRYAAIELIDWAVDGRLSPPLDEVEQESCKAILKDLFPEGLEKVTIYPSSWSESSSSLDHNRINVSRLKIEKMTPQAYEIIKNRL